MSALEASPAVSSEISVLYDSAKGTFNVANPQGVKLPESLVKAMASKTQQESIAIFKSLTAQDLVGVSINMLKDGYIVPMTFESISQLVNQAEVVDTSGSSSSSAAVSTTTSVALTTAEVATDKLTTPTGRVSPSLEGRVKDEGDAKKATSETKTNDTTKAVVPPAASGYLCAIL